jgi:hypothetical protein
MIIPTESPAPTEPKTILKNSILQKARSFVRSTQNPPEWPGARFLKPKNDKTFSDLDSKFERYLTEFELDINAGVMVDGISLSRAVLNHLSDPVAEDTKSAEQRGFWAGAAEALDWMGITKDKYSSQNSDICALEALAAAEGIPTSRQSNHTRPESLIGAKVNNISGVKTFDRGAVNGIIKTENGPVFLRLGKPEVQNELKEGYRKGVEVAFLHYVAIGHFKEIGEQVTIQPDNVRISQVERSSNAFSKK